MPPSTAVGKEVNSLKDKIPSLSTFNWVSEFFFTKKISSVLVFPISTSK